MSGLDAHRCRRAVLTLSLCAAGAMATIGPAWGQSWGLSELMQTLAQTRSARAVFTEKKFIGFMDQPVESSGELSFTAPDRLEKRTLQPRPEAIVLDGDRLTLEQGERRRMTLNLRSQPDAAAFVESIRATLAGDQAALEKFYAVELQGRAEAWKLTLVPRKDGMRKVVQRIRMEGARSAVSLIAFEQADGDRSEMRITRISEP